MLVLSDTSPCFNYVCNFAIPLQEQYHYDCRDYCLQCVIMYTIYIVHYFMIGNEPTQVLSSARSLSTRRMQTHIVGCRPTMCVVLKRNYFELN